jgi:hypothetical protein
MNPDLKKPLSIIEALRKQKLEVHTPKGIKTLARDEASGQWGVAEESYLHIASMKGDKIYEVVPVESLQAVPV